MIMFTENMGDYFQPSRCFSFAKPTVVRSHFRACTSPEVGGTCGLVPTSLPWQSGSQDGDSAPGVAIQGGGSGIQCLEEEEGRPKESEVPER